MRIIVQKFGGTSVVSRESRSAVVEKIKQARQKGYSSVVVVSAMGRKGEAYATDTLINLVKSENEQISLRELDVIMCCGEIISAAVMAATLQKEGVSSVALTGGQAGMITDGDYGSAKILRVETANLLSLLKQGITPVVCGFQGVTEDRMNITTIGRGGSDTTASALGAALDAEFVEIYTDVEGIMTADPRIVKEAQVLDYISYGEIAQLAHQGAKVVHPRAVEIAMQKNIPVYIKSTFSDAVGTLITNNTRVETSDVTIMERIASGVTYLPDIAQVKISIPDNDYTSSMTIFNVMAKNKISVDCLNVHPGEVLFTISENDVTRAIDALNSVGFKPTVVENCAKVSVVGDGMKDVPGVMASFVHAIVGQGVPILQTVDSNNTISAIVATEHLHKTVNALHEAFNPSK